MKRLGSTFLRNIAIVSALTAALGACDKKSNSEPTRELVPLPSAAASALAPNDLGTLSIHDVELNLAESVLPQEAPAKDGTLTAEFAVRRKELTASAIDLRRPKGRLWALTLEIRSQLLRKGYPTPMLRLESRSGKTYASSPELDGLVAEPLRPQRFSPLQGDESRRMQLLFDLPLNEKPNAIVAEGAEEGTRFSRRTIPLDSIRVLPTASAVLSRN